MRWRVLDSGAAEGAPLMAVDAGLMDRARDTGEAVLRVYAWSRPTLSFGRHEAARRRFDPEVLARAGVGAVRRPTGGRVLLHDAEVTYSATAPVRADEPLRASYRRINALLLAALARLGVTAQEAPARGRSLRPGAATCFAEPSAGELVVGARKLVGSAQVRSAGALLQHGSILLEDRQQRIPELAGVPVAPPAPAAALQPLLGRVVTYAEVRDALFAALGAALGGAGDVTPLDRAEAERFARAHVAAFASPEWTWRR